jgi:hypothetical protein
MVDPVELRTHLVVESCARTSAIAYVLSGIRCYDTWLIQLRDKA